MLHMKINKSISFWVLIVVLNLNLPIKAHADIMAWLSKCGQSLLDGSPNISAQFLTENSGFFSEHVATQILPFRLYDTGASSLQRPMESGLWNANLPVLKRQGNLYYLSVDSRIYSELGELQIEKEFVSIREALVKPMIPVLAERDGYMVYFGYKSAELWAGRHDYFALFSSLTLAEDFVNSHEFRVEQNYISN
jgi:hypothetical protein